MHYLVSLPNLLILVTFDYLIGILNSQTTRVALFYVNTVTYYMEDWCVSSLSLGIIKLYKIKQVRSACNPLLDNSNLS